MNELRYTPFRQVVVVALVAAIVLTLGACASAQVKADKLRNLALITTTDDYRKQVRWGMFEEARRHLKAREGETRMPAMNRYKAWRITSYNVGEMTKNETGNEVKIAAHIEFYSTDTGVASSMNYEQLWWFDAKAKLWYLDGSLPDFDGATRFKN